MSWAHACVVGMISVLRRAPPPLLGAGTVCLACVGGRVRVSGGTSLHSQLVVRGLGAVPWCRAALRVSELARRRRVAMWGRLARRSRTALTVAGGVPGAGGSDTEFPSDSMASSGSSSSGGEDGGTYGSGIVQLQTSTGARERRGGAALRAGAVSRARMRQSTMSTASARPVVASAVTRSHTSMAASNHTINNTLTTLPAPTSTTASSVVASAGARAAGRAALSGAPKRRKRSRDEEVLLVEKLRVLGDAASDRVRKVRAESREAAIAREDVSRFRIPGGSFVDPERPLACDKWLERGADLLVEWRAFSTWRTYGGYIDDTLAWLRRNVEDSGMVWHAKTLRDEPRFFSAYAVYLLHTTSTITAVEKPIQALRLAMRVNGIKVQDDLLTSVVREVNRRRRSKSVRKRPGLLFSEVTAINIGWGHPSQSMGRRTIALAMCIAFVALLRFSDLAVIHIHGIYFCPEGVMICLPRRKNNQHGVPSYIPVADTEIVDAKGKACSLVARLRLYITDLTGVTPPDEGFMECPASKGFLFRRVTKVDEYTHYSKRTDEVSGSGCRPMSRAAYAGYLSRYRDALVACCRMSRRAADAYGTQSARSGGDTHLFDNGVSSDLRMEIGEWATPLVERGYLRIRVQKKLELMRTVGL